ncbi:hypothetical protein DFS34DRAFT_631377 [Phlyctochytrium arcticum]|nr:hypothetical protein DFS34DRAFT_631377 [Phlyctochytrium arcticum]
MRTARCPRFGFLATLVVLGACARQSSAQAVLGGACQVAVDVFGCQGKNYMTCDPQSNRWILQNVCVEDCLTIPSFAQNCGRNQHGIEGSEKPPAPASPSKQVPQPTPEPAPAPPPKPPVATAAPTPTIASSAPITISPTATPIAVSNIPANRDPAITPNVIPAIPGPDEATENNGNGSKSSTSQAVILGSTVTAAALVLSGALAAVFYRHRRKPIAKDASLLPTTITSVLERRYRVTHMYQPAADDEIALHMGDVVRLSLLFNDGWAKGMNESTGQIGLLPCACIEEVSLEESEGGQPFRRTSQTAKTPIPSSG